MTGELKTFVAQLLVVGGRAVRTSPPGALAEAAPRRANRAREGDTFFILITPAQGVHAPSAFFEDLARLAADTYYGSGGGVTGGLREALTAVNTRLVGAPAGETRQVSALALVLRGDELFAARCGQSFGVWCHGGEITTFPGNRRDPLSLNAPLLGADAYADVEFRRYTVAPGQVMLIANAGLLDAEDGALCAALSAGGVAAVLDRLKPLAAPEASAMVVEFVVPDTPDPDNLAPAARDGETSRPVTMQPLRRSRPRLADARPQTASRPRIPSAASPPTLPERPAVAPIPPADILSPAAVTPAGEPPVGGPFPDAQSEQAAAVIGAPATPGRLSGAAGQLQRLRLAPQDAALTVRRRVRDVLTVVLSGLLRITNFFARLLDVILPEPGEDGKQGIPTNVAIGMAILIPLTIVIIVLGLSLSEQGKSDFEVYLDTAQRAHQDAMTRSGGNCEDKSLRPAWEDVLRLINQAGEFRPDDLDVLRISADAQNYLDCYDKVERLNLTLLHEFPDGADLAGPIVHGGVDVYTLDRATGAVYHDTLNENGDGLTARGDIPIFQTGSAVGAFIVGDVFDIDWLPSGGTVHDNVLVAADRSGVLLSYSPTFFASAQQLVAEGRWVNPVAIAVFRSNLYVLDPGADQIWRYVPPAGERRYSSAPEEYFTGEQRPDLEGAVDFGITDTGEVFVLFESGVVQQYRGGEFQSFAFSQQPTGVLNHASNLFVDNDPASRHLYIVDREAQMIYETSWAGTFKRSIRPAQHADNFRDVSGIYADSVVRNNMYVVAGNRLYHMRRSE
ncbi:MAG: hypothetical protein JW966_15365 [Anaerolineae bacterium]|nr:hypothetical protein [Anaerolineae bacterium]